MTKALDEALQAVEAMGSRRKIHFEDHGQDFLWFIVDETGRVQDVGPLQGCAWAGKTGYIETFGGKQHFCIYNRPIIYPVTMIEEC